MSVDLSQFHQVFFEESYEGLDVMESSLLNLDTRAIDLDSINEIFRAAHSIKGGSATFGFQDIADFTHVVETLLDQIRSGEFEIQAQHVELFLRAVDCVRTMINELEANGSCDTTIAGELKVSFDDILEGKDVQTIPVSSKEAEESELLNSESNPDIEISKEHTQDDHVNNDHVNSDQAQGQGQKVWQIYFKPSEDILKTGNDPIRMFRELDEMGEMQLEVILDDLPDIANFDPLSCYLSWSIQLQADVEQSTIEEVFEWVADESDIRIESSSTEFKEQIPTEEPDKLPIETLQQNETELLIDQPTQTYSVADLSSVQKSDTPKKEIQKTQKEPKNESASIRVGTDKLDSLINMVGELVITQSMLNELGKDFTMSNLPRLLDGLEQLSQHTRDLQESVMRIRMLPISFVFSRFPRLVHDMSKALNKKVELVLLGEQTELDKTVMEKIGDPLIHLVRNSLDHGIEGPEERIQCNKHEFGKVTLNAFHQGGNIVIQIIDDGAGLNEERILQKAIEKGLVSSSDTLAPAQIHDLIFQAGFSTAEVVSDISGRGVGMDVVRNNIKELNGTVEVESNRGKGSIFTIRLPLTLAILDGQLIRLGRQVYIVPLVCIVESIETKNQTIHRVSGGSDVLLIRNEYIPIIRLSEILNIKQDAGASTGGILVVVESENIKVALMVDDLLEQQQVVIKSLQKNYRTVPGVSGATILGNGSVSLILDINGLIKIADLGQNAYRIVQDSDETAA